MSVERIAQVLNLDLPISTTAKFVLVGIANHDGEGGAWPSIATLARYVGVHRRTVERHLKELEAAGLIERVRGAGGLRDHANHLRPNLYRFHLPERPDTRVGSPPDGDAGSPPDNSVGSRVSPNGTSVGSPPTPASGDPPTPVPHEPSSEPSINQQQSAREVKEGSDPPPTADPPAAAVASQGTQTDEAWALGRLLAVAGTPSIGLDAAGCRALVPPMVTALVRLHGNRGEAEAWLRRLAGQAREKPRPAGWLRKTLPARAEDATAVSDGSTRPELQLHRARPEERQPAPYPMSLTLRALREDPEGWELVRHDPGSARSFLAARYPREFAAWAEQAGVPA